jgi:hypothetical protein
MAFSIALSVLAVSPLLMAHLLVRPSAKEARRLRARNDVHRRLAQLQTEEVELHRRITNRLR